MTNTLLPSPGEGGANGRSVVGSVNFAGNKLTAC